MSACTTLGAPTVSVPVLSNTTVLILLNRSNCSACRNRKPCFAAAPAATTTAIGVARPNAHGQAITSTLRPNITASAPWPTASQNRNVNAATTNTTGTKRREMASTVRCTGNRVRWAVVTSSAIFASVV